MNTFRERFAPHTLERMMQRFDPVTCGFLASASAVVNVAFLKIATHPVDPLDIEALARLGSEAVPWLVVSLVADLAFYLLLIPVALGLGGRVAQWAGVAYALIGAAGALERETRTGPRTRNANRRGRHAIVMPGPARVAPAIPVRAPS